MILFISEQIFIKILLVLAILDEPRLKTFDGNFSVKKFKLSQMDKSYMVYCKCWYKIYKNSFLKQNNIKFSNNHAKYENHFLLYANTVSIINKPLYNYRIRETSISQSVKNWDDLKSVAHKMSIGN